VNLIGIKRADGNSSIQTPFLRVEFLLKTDSGYPKDRVTFFTLATPENPLRYNTHRSAPPVSALDHSRGPRKRSQSPVHMLEHRDTHGQAQVCSKGHQGSSVDRPCQPSFLWIKFWHVWNPLPQYSTTSQCLSALPGRPGRVISQTRKQTSQLWKPSAALPRVRLLF